MPDITQLATDKQFLQSIADNDHTIPDNIDRFAFIKSMLQNFQSPDGYLRDELTYVTIAQNIIHKQDLTPAQLEELLLTCLDQAHLFYHIGEAGTDAVFMRSFSLLVAAAILYFDGHTNQLSEHIAHQARTALLLYARRERDWRGYIKGKGWAHAVAHLADALDECAQNRFATSADREEIMRTTRDLARLPEPLAFEEDERLAYIAYRVITQQQVSETFLSEWISSCFVERRQDGIANEQTVATWVRAANAKNFLRSLYFRLQRNQQAIHLLEPITDILNRLDSFPAE